ncbi:ComEA family DNA-binding protein [Uliginosibacterium sp. H1]|uniref:ComEA family DNA-binding protein n=1 Tax=Uliginosibacterium sp. H1 TaxID=3114757 RepID=UPI002E17CDB2|nr:helix-hairpin-helix domain-containing protein [Uliginosibacterium sp. H1]
MLKKVLVSLFSIIASIGVAIAAVNINTATEKELETLPGIGPAKAKAIIDHRKKNGNFKTLESLKDVNGIGDATYAELKGKISVSGSTTTEAAPAAKDAKKEPAKK